MAVFACVREDTDFSESTCHLIPVASDFGGVGIFSAAILASRDFCQTNPAGVDNDQKRSRCY